MTYTLEHALTRSGPFRHATMLASTDIRNAISEALARRDRWVWARLVPDGRAEYATYIAPDSALDTYIERE